MSESIGLVTGRGLSGISDPDLASLAVSLERGQLSQPFTSAALQARGFGHLEAQLQPFLALDAAALGAVVFAVLAERQHRRNPQLTLVWTGEDPGVGQTRYTRVVLPELFSQARQHVLIAGYSFDHSADLFRPLHQSMKAHGTTAEFFVDIQQLIERLRAAAKAAKKDWGLLAGPLTATRSPEERGHAAIELFFNLMWPFGDPKPTVYFDPRTASVNNVISLHAKCVVVDHRFALITSANFTNRGQKRNFEAGVAIEDEWFAKTLERQWGNLVDAGVVVALAGRRA